jgi:hypothetical protein
LELSFGPLAAIGAKEGHEEIQGSGMNGIWDRVILSVLLIAALAIIWNVLGY